MSFYVIRIPPGNQHRPPPTEFFLFRNEEYGIDEAVYGTSPRPSGAGLRGGGQIEYSQSVVFTLYSLLLTLALAFYFPIYSLRLRFFRKEKLFLRQRLGAGRPMKNHSKPSIWIHAVSVGEVLSLQNLVKKLREHHPDWDLNFSVLTNTGYRMALEKIREADHIFFVPLDFSRVVRRFFKSLKPRLLVLAESEYWPNLLREAKRSEARVLLINGRVSRRSFKRYKIFRPAAMRILNLVDCFLVQSDLDRERLIKLGVDASRVEQSGNLKCEVVLPEMSDREVSDFKKSLGIEETRKVITAGSTRKGEEDILAGALLDARAGNGDPVLILAPRHLERCSEVEKICAELGLSVRRRTEASWNNPPGDILLLDTMGELAKFYSLANVAFVGGSLVPWGGHNLLEPAFFAKPIFFGPHMDNFSYLAEAFLRVSGAKVVRSRAELAEVFRMKNADGLAEMGRRAKTALQSLQGATGRTIRTIERMMAADGEEQRPADSQRERRENSETGPS